MSQDDPAQLRQGTDSETDDVFLGGRLSLLQPRRGFRAGIDAVLLAAAVPPLAPQAHRVLDAGAGVGTAGLCLACRQACASIVLLEREPRLAGLARQNASRNGLDGRVRVVEVDVLAGSAAHEAAGLAAGSFDCVMTNPPWLVCGEGRLPADPIEAAADAMAAEDLERWMRALARLAAPGATLVLVHRADALARVLGVLESRFGGVEVMPLHPTANARATRILVRARKGSRAPLALLPGLAVHSADRHFAPEVEGVLRRGEALAWPGR